MQLLFTYYAFGFRMIANIPNIHTKYIHRPLLDAQSSSVIISLVRVCNDAVINQQINEDYRAMSTVLITHV